MLAVEIALTEMLSLLTEHVVEATAAAVLLPGLRDTVRPLRVRYKVVSFFSSSAVPEAFVRPLVETEIVRLAPRLLTEFQLGPSSDTDALPAHVALDTRLPASTVVAA